MAAKRSSSEADRKLESGTAGLPSKPDRRIHPAFFITLWIFMSSSVILFNKWVLATAKFALFLTTWHMVFATATTQIMARFTKTLDSRHKVPMNANIYGRSIVPIGIMFSFSLICGNMAYLYLSVSFIQMLKATNAVATLLATWAFRIAPPNVKVLGNVSVIVMGIIIASFGEIKFDLTGFIYQVSGILFEALRLVMVQRLLSSAEFKMDPLVSLYYYAPACAVTNGIFTLFIEIPRITMGDIYSVGIGTLIANAIIAFLLNVSVVLLIGQTSAVVLTMSGVLKDILLVVASMVIFRDPVTGQQFFGYSIALAGLVYYRLGAEKVQALAKDAQLQLGQFRHNNPARTRVLVNLAVFVVIILGLLVWGPTLLGGRLEATAGDASHRI
ncbi:triose-phosphate transporter family-domain-containing protein [Dactylonectria macrodidyma]|uniref:Triose-phosphate transporter family-domain-containing protein n=1 Tax=Dactylonectria macrodidyma TaxID=307937 RepID=A0A9P9JM33_9HYPO|nr:triose-phosphate transporter family-domain-containing protein [Dactylonectria macrodidyma]